MIYRGGVICIKWENIGVGNVGIQCSLLESGNKKTGHALNSKNFCYYMSNDLLKSNA